MKVGRQMVGQNGGAKWEDILYHFVRPSGATQNVFIAISEAVPEDFICEEVAPPIDNSNIKSPESRFRGLTCITYC